jgi:magnesium chelatase family protein
VSGPLLDRIDLHVPVERPAPGALLQGEPGTEDSATVRERVMAAHARALARQGSSNAALSSRRLLEHVRLDTQAAATFAGALSRLQLSARAAHRCLRVARTLADLEGAQSVQPSHLAEAIGYRAREPT